MWNLLKRSKEECRRLGGAVEEAAAKQADAVSVKNLTEALTPDERTHMATCQDCARAVREVFRAKQLFQRAASSRQGEGAWCAAREMAASAAREKARAERVTAGTEFARC